jgi:branched-chain amino acid transport system permease protein
MLTQQLLNGLVVGSTYALFALGFTIMFGVLGVINLTYGFYFSVGAFLALFATRDLQLSIWLALPLAAVGSGLLATVLDGLLLTPLRRAKAPELASLMVTLGATLLLYSLANAAFGTDIRRFPADVINANAIEVAGVRVTQTQILIIGMTAVTVVALLALMQWTRVGLGIRALAEWPETAALLCVYGNALVRLVSFVSGLMGGMAGVLVGLNYNAIQPYMGEFMMLKGFAVIILGGLGDIRGALAAGLIIGMLETLTAGYVASTWKDAVGFALLVLTLWFRPSGLFGRAIVKRA